MERIIENNQIVDLDKIQPNDYNPKPDFRESEELKIEFEKLKSALKYHGQIDPLIVREIGEEKYELINGYHRWLAMKELGWKRAEIKNLGKISKEEAIKKALTLEEIRIPLDVIEVAELLKNLKEAEVELEGLPYLEQEIRERIELLDFDWSDFKEVEVIEEDIEKIENLEKKKKCYFALKENDYERVVKFFKRKNSIYRLDEKKLLKLLPQD